MQGGFRCQCQGPFASTEQGRKIKGRPTRCKRLHLQQLVQCVAGVSAQNFRMWVGFLYEISVLLEQIGHPPVDGPLERTLLLLLMQFIRGDGAECCLGTITKDGTNLEGVFSCGLIFDRIGSAGVVADHAADHAPVGGGGVRAKLKSVLGSFPI